jgi:hypothetical protein
LEARDVVEAHALLEIGAHFHATDAPSAVDHHLRSLIEP